MKSKNYSFIAQALLAAVFFGASAPLTKLLLGSVPAVFLAALLYIGSGAGISLVRLFIRLRSPGRVIEADIVRSDVPWLVGAILAGGVAAPIVLMLSLRNTPASTASLLLNFEGVATTLIAMLFFREAVSRWAWAAMLLITLASALLSTRLEGAWGISPGALGILLATSLWGLDNNFTRNISGKDPLAIVAWKGLSAGAFSFVLALFLGERLPSLFAAAAALLVGWVSYGLSTLLFIRAMRGLGAARTSALYGTAPLAGVLLSILIFSERPTTAFAAAMLLILAGAYLLVREVHSHPHVHTAQVHEHSHSHADPAHAHASTEAPHAHEHEHPAEEHEHDHMPDLHHRHGHQDQ